MHEYRKTAVSFLDVVTRIKLTISISLYEETGNHRYRHSTSQQSSYAHKTFYASFTTFHFIICSKELVSHFLHIVHPIKVVLRQLGNASRVHRASLFTYRQTTIDNHILLVHAYNPAMVFTNKLVNKDWKHLSTIISLKHLFCNSLVCACRQLPKLKRMLVNSDLSRIPALVGNSKYMKPHCKVCDMLDAHIHHSTREIQLSFI